MKIWLIQRAEPLPIDKGQQRLLRTGLLAEALLRRGHSVLWWTSTFDHSLKTYRSHEDTLVHISNNYDVCMIHGCGYKKNRSLSRFIDQRIIAEKFKKLATKEARPDMIVSSLPSVELCLAAVQYGQQKNVPVLLDMRDMWPDIFVDAFPKILRGFAQLGLWPLFREARQACGMATAISGITEQFVEWGLQKGHRSRTALDKSFPMGYKDDPPDEHSLAEAEKYWDSLGVLKNPKELVVCFSGALNWQFDLKTAILAVHRCVTKGVPVKFVICGSGDRSDYFKQLAKNVPGIIFSGFVNRAKLYSLMRRSTLGLDPLPDRYDYLASINNKAIEYFSAGLPVISCPQKGVLFNLLAEQNCGLSFKHGDANGLFHLFSRLSRERSSIGQMSQNGKSLFHKRFSADKVYSEMASAIETIAETMSRHK